MFFSRAINAVAVLLLVGCNAVDNSIDSNNGSRDTERDIARAFIDAFYSFDSKQLSMALVNAEKSVPSISYYQGWAKGGHYQIVNRMPCKIVDADKISCSITVEDDHMKALNIDFNVTDTFTLSFADGNIISVTTSSNDLQVYRDAAKWVRSELPELVSEPCKKFFNGGTTPEECSRVMALGYKKYSESDNFPEKYKK